MVAALCYKNDYRNIIRYFTSSLWSPVYQFGTSQLPKWLTNERPTWCHLLFYFTYYALNMFRTLVYPSSGACDRVDELPHRSSCSQFVACWSFCCGWYLVVFVLQASAWTENKTTDVVIHQHGRKLLQMDILMSETCWAHNKWNKIASDIKLVFHSSNFIYFISHLWKFFRYFF